MLPWSAVEIGRYPWHALPDLIGNVIAVIFVTASSALFNTTGVEVATHREANLERELTTTGIANILSGAFGGYTGCISVSRSILNFNSGGKRPPFRPDQRCDFGVDAGGGAHAARLYAEIRARRPADLSRRGPASQMDRSVAAAAFVYRISVAAGDHRHHRAMGLHRRHPDRRRDRLRDVCAERLAHRFHQIQLRRLGISQLAGPLARRSGGAVGAWRQDPGPEPAELSVLRLGQPALPARQGAAAAPSGVPVSGVRLQAGHRHRFLGGLQFRPDQADRARSRHQTGAGPPAIRGREGPAIERFHHARGQHRA